MHASRNYKGDGDPRVKAILWTVILGLLAVIGWLAFEHPQQVERTLSSAATAVENPIAPLVEQIPGMQFGTLSRPTTILFMGCDVVYADPRRRTVDRSSTRGNSDSMMLVFLNPERNSVAVLNIPRDTEATVGGVVRKINSANMIGGPELAKQTVTQLLDVPIDHYVVMNVHALVDLVNELGGVTVNVPKPMSYMDWTAKLKIDLQPGYHTLTGNQAMGFVRFRHDALGDIGRIQRQQIFMQAAIAKMLQPSSWLHLSKLLQIGQANIETDMSNVDIFQTLNFYHNVPKQNTRFVMLPGEFANNGDWLANTDSKEVAQKLADPDSDSVSSRRNVTVTVVNASSDPSLGGKVATALRKLGYITGVGKDENEPATNHTRVIAQKGNVADATMMKNDLGTGEVVSASVGNLLTAITVVVHDDVNPENIKMSSEDAPYIPRSMRPSLLVPHQAAPPLIGMRGRNSSANSQAASPDAVQQTDLQGLPQSDETPMYVQQPDTANDVNNSVKTNQSSEGLGAQVYVPPTNTDPTKQSTDSRSSESRTSESRSSESRESEPRSSESRGAESHSSESRGTEPRTSGGERESTPTTEPSTTHSEKNEPGVP